MLGSTEITSRGKAPNIGKDTATQVTALFDRSIEMHNKVLNAYNEAHAIQAASAVRSMGDKVLYSQACLDLLGELTALLNGQNIEAYWAIVVKEHRKRIGGIAQMPWKHISSRAMDNLAAQADAGALVAYLKFMALLLDTLAGV